MREVSQRELEMVSGGNYPTGTHINGSNPANLYIIDYSGAYTAGQAAQQLAAETASQEGGGGSGTAPATSSYDVDFIALDDDQGIMIRSDVALDSTTQALIDKMVAGANIIADHMTQFDVQNPNVDYNLGVNARNITTVEYTGASGRSWVNVNTGTLYLSQPDLAGSGGGSGYTAGDIADRIIHDGQHITQHLLGYDTGARYDTAAGMSIAIGNELDAIQVELDADAILGTTIVPQSHVDWLQHLMNDVDGQNLLMNNLNVAPTRHVSYYNGGGDTGGGGGGDGQINS